MNKEMEDCLKKTAQMVRDSGLRAGSKAMCGVILEKATDRTKSDKQKLKDIVSFCKRSLGIEKKFKEANEHTALREGK